MGRRIAFGLRDEWALEAATSSLERAPATLTGELSLHVASRRAGLIRVEASIQATTGASCDRCGEACELSMEELSVLLYAPEESGGEAYDGGEIELSAEELDLGWYRGGAIDLADVLREAVALALPARIVCTDTPQCDRRTDALLAEHAAKPGHPAFETLQVLKQGVDDVG